MRFGLRALCAASAGLLLGICAWFAHGDAVRGSPSTPLSASARAPLAPVLPRRESAVDTCALRRDALRAERELPGTPGLNATRAEIVARVRAEPVLFLRAPESRISARAAALRTRLFDGREPWTVFAELVRGLRSEPALFREVVLRNGYLYAEEPGMAVLLASGLRLAYLFDEPQIEILRGERVLHARRHRGEYVWSDGPEAGERAALWMFDRVTVAGVDLGPPDHVALGELGELGARRVDIERITERGVLAKLDYGTFSVPAVFSMESRRLRLECESVDRSVAGELASRRALARRRATLLSVLRQHVADEVAEALPFDEPLTEEGQQDGKLRLGWRDAYFRGESSFLFNGDRYDVFDAAGRPRLPQVCADFVVDTWERMAGTRFLNRREGRARKVGRIDFSALGIVNKRSVEQLIEFARQHPEWFELLEIPERKRVPFEKRHQFFRRLRERSDDFRAGDVVAILGPRDDEQLHYHSFFIMAEDPLSGMPTLLASNAGRPRMRAWEAELENAPRRGICARIRPRLDWLESLTGSAAEGP